MLFNTKKVCQECGGQNNYNSIFKNSSHNFKKFWPTSLNTQKKSLKKILLHTM